MPLCGRVGRAGGDRPRAAHARAFGLHRGERREGIPRRKKENKLGLRASDTSELISKIALCPMKICWEGSGGFIDAMRVLDGGRISIAASRSECGRRIRRGTEVFERARAIWQGDFEFQAIQWKLPTCNGNRSRKASDLSSAAMKDAGMKTTLESSMAKLYASEVR